MSKWHGGKGSTPRPQSVDRKTFEDNWDRIFGKTTGKIHQDGLEPDLNEDFDRFEEQMSEDDSTDKE